MHGYVGHAIIPYEIGGPVDMYYSRHAVIVPDRNALLDALDQRLRSIFANIGRYSEKTALNSGDTAEVLVGDNEPNACILFTTPEGRVSFRVGPREHGLLVVTEVFPDEMALSRERGNSELIARL